MKFLLLASLAVTVHILIGESEALEIPETYKVQARKLHNLCKNEIGIPEEIIQQSLTGPLPNDRRLQCYLHCLFAKVGLIDNSNTVRLESLTEILPAELHPPINKLVQACGTKPGADGCETAFLTVKCYFEKEPEMLHGKFNFIFS